MTRFGLKHTDTTNTKSIAYDQSQITNTCTRPWRVFKTINKSKRDEIQTEAALTVLVCAMGAMGSLCGMDVAGASGTGGAGARVFCCCCCGWDWMPLVRWPEHTKGTKSGQNHCYLFLRNRKAVLLKSPISLCLKVVVCTNTMLEGTSIKHSYTMRWSQYEPW